VCFESFVRCYEEGFSAISRISRAGLNTLTLLLLHPLPSSSHLTSLSALPPSRPWLVVWVAIKICLVLVSEQ
jgi:hypothetical protein